MAEEPISFNVTTTKIDGEYKLQPISQQIFNNAKVNVNKNLIQIDVTNDKKPDAPKVEGKYDVLIQKINSETKEGLNGVKIHVEAVDSNEQSLINKDYTTEEKEGKNGYVQINDISILKSGVHKYKIEEIETVNGYVKFEKPITFEAEVGLNSKEDAYTIKSVKNIGDYSGKVKIEYNEDSNNLIIVLPNDPTKEAGDLALRKFITSVNEKSLDTSRVPVAKMNNVTGKIEYMQTKKEVEVNVGDYILYTLRVYNEGKTEGTASLIKDYLPKGLEFVNNNIVNNQYNWKMLDKDGKVTNNSNDAVFIATDYLNGSVIPAYSGEGTPSYLDVKVVLKVTQEAEKEGRLVNIAFIGEDNIEDKEDFVLESKVKINDEYIPTFEKQTSFPAINIGHLGVRTDLQCKGIGEQILDFVLYTFSNFDISGFQFITVDSLNNSRTNKFYARNGFVNQTNSDNCNSTRRMYLPIQLFELMGDIE